MLASHPISPLYLHSCTTGVAAGGATSGLCQRLGAYAGGPGNHSERRSVGASGPVTASGTMPQKNLITHDGSMVLVYIWVNYNELTTSSLEIIVSKGNHPQMALIQVSELLLFTQIYANKKGVFVDGIHVTIYGSTMDPMGYIEWPFQDPTHWRYRFHIF